MPLNYLELQPQIRQFAAQAQAAQKGLKEKLEIARALLKQCASEPLENWKGRIQSTSQRCALPVWENPGQTFAAAAGEATYVLLAADGSQIVPGGHEPVPLALINTSLISLDVRSSQAPEVKIRTEILNEIHEEIELALLSEDLIRLKRDIAELKIFLDWKLDTEAPIIAVRDGPLELYHEPRQEKEFQGAFEEYKNLLGVLIGRNFIPAGYIDRSRATLVTRMLDLYANGEREGSAAQLLPDVVLMASILQSGQRSAIYELHSSSNVHYRDDLHICFFYLNVGKAEKPYIVRVEIPAWAARDEQKVGLLQRALLDQCRIMSNRPYPYLLHRAHEEAVVRYAENEQLQNMLNAALQQEGLGLRLPSNKLAAKELQKRTRL